MNGLFISWRFTHDEYHFPTSKKGRCMLKEYLLGLWEKPIALNPIVELIIAIIIAKMCFSTCRNIKMLFFLINR